MEKVQIKLNQVWKSKLSSFQIVISGKAKESHKWKTKVLTEKPGVFAGSHTMSEHTLWKKFDLIK